VCDDPRLCEAIDEFRASDSVRAQPCDGLIFVHIKHIDIAVQAGVRRPSDHKTPG